MEGSWIAVQLVVEPRWGIRSLEEIARRIDEARELAGIKGLILWPGMTDLDPLVRQCHDRGLEAYLWFPVLSDLPGYPPAAGELLVDVEDKTGQGTLGAWEGLGTGGEDFLFLCPNNPRASDKVLAAYRRLLDLSDWDGVMLDRIRYPSPANGLESLFTCYCPHCQEGFVQTFGITLESCRQATRKLLAALKKIRAAELQRWESLPALWEAFELAPFFSFRGRSILRVVQSLAREAHSRGLRVGLDLFSPSLAPLVAQDYVLLSRICDWIKPMIYCHALGPAGLPLELACLWEALRLLCPRVPSEALRDWLAKSLSWELPADRELLLREGLPEDTLARELGKIEGWGLPPGVKILPGVEAVHKPEYGIAIDPPLLDRYLDRLPRSLEGMVASWNLLDIPGENLKVIGSRFRELRRNRR